MAEIKADIENINLHDKSINSSNEQINQNDSSESNLKQRLISKNEDQENKEIQIQNENKVQQPAAPAKARLECLDIYRGLTMVGMILVDNMGNSSVIWPLDETEWNGLSTADCVFPSFLFISGMAITLAVKQNGDKKQQFIRILERFVKLFVIGVALNAACRNYQQQFRIMGVLQRIALCYFVTSTSYLYLRKFLYQLILNGFFLLIYVYFMYFFPVPNGCGANNVTPQCNFGKYLDESIFTLNYMMKPSDPEGLFTTLTAFITTFIGLCYGLVLSEFKNEKKKLSFIWFLMSCTLVFLGLICDLLSPINKKVWTPAFVFVVGGMSGAFLNLCMIIVDIYNNIKINKCLQWLKWLGLNPLFVFVTMIWLELVMLLNVHFYVDGEKYSFWNFITKYAFQSWLVNSYVASLGVSLFHLGIWVFVSYYLFQRKIFIKL